MGMKAFQDERTTVAIPCGVLQKGQDTRVSVTNLGSQPLRWSKGKVVARGRRCEEGTTVGPIVKHGKVGNIQILDDFKLKANFFSLGEGDLGLTEEPIYYRPYRLSQTERDKLREKVKTLLESSVIQESSSDYASPIILVTKKDGGIRMCVDYRALNAITVKDRYPLQLIEDQLDRLANKYYFTTLDLAQRYHQVPMHPESVHKTVHNSR